MQQSSRSLVLVAVWLGVAALTWFAAGSSSEAAGGQVVTVTFLEGQVKHKATGKGWRKVRLGSGLQQGDRLRTGDDGRLEAKTADGSILRLGKNSEMDLDRAFVTKRGKQRQISVRLVAGRVWASVTKLFGANSSFRVTTSNAVAGVRGTRFSANALPSGDTVVKVYEGQVLVSNKPVYAIQGHTKAQRVQVAGPQEISRTQWEELVASAMEKIRVAASGDLSTAERFALAEPGSNDWEAWNRGRDAAAGFE